MHVYMLIDARINDNFR